MSEAREQMFRLRFQLRMGHADGIKKYRVLRKDIARMLMVETERKRAAAEAKKGQ
jgi:large subunit ribosomal protein L29